MSDKMVPVKFEKLLNWIINEYRNHSSVFGIPRDQFFTPSRNEYKLFGSRLDTLIGPAAGPHTQMAQNIISAYLTGGRFIELKTIQILDELDITKPCIDATDECYNIEWSQELKLRQSYEEYLKAWLLLHFVKHLLKLSDCSEPGFIFNMSVGYDLKGIKSEPIDKFIDELINGKNNSLSEIFLESMNDFISAEESGKLIRSINPDFNFDLSNVHLNISNSVTLSTMHGCPPHEIEAIADYLMSEKKLHTYIKLNPTLLGYEFINNTLPQLGYKYLFVNKDVFEKDLKLTDALPMINRLQKTANDNNLQFGIKLSNTLPVDNRKSKLKEDDMYMSGRSLFPFTINLASLIAEELKGDINISYSGGASFYNIMDIIECGIKPVTFATDLLKPGGYGRLKQIAEKIDGNIVSEDLDLNKLWRLANKSLIDDHYRKEKRAIDSIKISKSLPLIDCYMAPCQEACPIHQDIPAYINLVRNKEYSKALDVITRDNPLPHITGYICDHQCQFHCTRWDYDDPVLIRDIKKEAALKGYAKFIELYNFPADIKNNPDKTAVLGAGPAGLSAAYFLSRAGFDVTLFEKENNAGGIVKNIIPHFRLPEEAIEKDIEFIEKHGVRFVFGNEYNFKIENLRKEGYKYIVIAIGASVSNHIQLNSSNSGVVDALDFLWELNHKGDVDLGASAAVIGGGNSAMDSARAALRVKGVKQVYLIYRRTIEFMPADMEEFYNAVEDGAEYKELLQPISFENGILKCQKMQLGKYGPDGRRSVYPVENNFIDLDVDTVISAIGEHADFDLLSENKITAESGKAYKHKESLETTLKDVFICGDAKAGPATVVEAIADARKAVNSILSREKKNDIVPAFSEKLTKVKNKSYIMPGNTQDAAEESERCLMCSYECNKCVDVCPNRANIAVKVENDLFHDSHQILHLESLCNECGNCATFCPYTASPYKEKLTYFLTEQDMYLHSNNGFTFLSGSKVRIKFNGSNEEYDINLKDYDDQINSIIELIKKFRENYNYFEN